MQVTPVKSGSRGRPRFRRYKGLITSHGPYWAFIPDSPDLFGHDGVLLNLEPSFFKFRQRVISICRSLSKGNSVHVELAFTGNYLIKDQLSFFDFRFVSFL